MLNGHKNFTIYFIDTTVICYGVVCKTFIRSDIIAHGHHKKPFYLEIKHVRFESTCHMHAL